MEKLLSDRFSKKCCVPKFGVAAAQWTSHRYFQGTFPLSRIGRSSASTIGSQKSSGQSPDERHKGRERERERGDLDEARRVEMAHLVSHSKAAAARQALPGAASSKR